MYIEPNTNIKILKNVPLDKTYEHTLYFADKTAQYNYFSSLVKYNLTDQTYQRVQRGEANVQYKAENLYDCNYLMFQNTNFGNKWFYAFITSVEYVNNIVSKITFEIDVMQTWLVNYDYNLKDCFVEREHSDRDLLGDTMVQEDIQISDYVNNRYLYDSFGYMKVGWFGLYNPSEVITDQNKLDKADGEVIDNVFTGYKLFTRPLVTSSPPNDGEIDVSDVSYVNDALRYYAEKGVVDSVAGVIMFPSICVTEQEQTVTINRQDYLDGYKPKNKKLYNYPYNFILADNNNGTTSIFKWEYFSDTKVVSFASRGSVATQPCVLTYPKDYKGVEKNYNEAFVNTGFPVCSYNVNSFDNWFANNRGAMASTAVSAIGDTIMVGANTAMGNTIGASGSAISGIAKVSALIGSIHDNSVNPVQGKGQVMCDCLNTAIKRNGVTYYQKCFPREVLEIYDNYFTKYGYKTMKLKVPNISSRPHWNYVKTVNATIVGSVPSDDLNKIISIYDNGVTFWKNGSEVGNYSLDNSPTS